MVDGHLMTAEEAAGSRFSHVLVNAVGGSTDDINVEMRHLTVQLDDLLLLCTDGLYDMLPDDRIAELLRSNQPVTQIVTELIAAATAAGGRDNVTAGVARF
jgi:PPM family protein phosphatase